MPIIPTVKCSLIAPSVAFYTEVLDFEVRREWSVLTDPGFAWLTRGGDILHLSSHSGDGVFGQAIVVETPEVDSLFETFRARGLDPSGKTDSPVHQAPLDQTWGTREIYVDDPDGNTLRFTQRRVERQGSTFPAACPEIPVADLQAALAEYRDHFGFTVDWVADDIGLGQVSRGASRFFLATQGFRQGGRVRVWINLANRAEVDALHVEWTAAGAVVDGPPEPKPWKLHEFTATDTSGNLLRVFYEFGGEDCA